ncbi:hypothetical protein M3197_09015 [Sporosarcina aquimarina]|uniref:hypothetical protein n=1 Tax=Sporosarcina aquimarina TaxID=114975 RepID=UPI00203F70AA|nr:hypothetical protein [Sporosarcina aquimarina]MCM3757629.1 hypothetical protein [Sporosarcina aquimarina]
MKKLLLLGALSFMLAGCTSNEPAQESDTSDENTNSLEENSVNTAPEDNNKAEEQASETATKNSDLATYEEYSKIAEVGDIEGLKGIVESDNPGTRVILFEDESGIKKVKSVYVKKENRLKVISLDDDGLLYNDILK